MRVRTASSSAVAESSASVFASRNVAQLGRYEYWSATVATSPWKRSSIPLVAFSSTHPDPVGTATTTCDFVRPPECSSSSTAICARAVALDAASSAT